MKKKPSLPALLLSFSLLAPVFGQTPQPSPSTRTPLTPPPSAATQQPSPTPAPQDDSDENVVKITTNLVQFDAVVTDKKGQTVTDLQPEDFEVFVGGKRQQVTNFSYISTESGAPPVRQPARSTADKSAPPIPPARLKLGQVRRTIALVVDDLHLEAPSMHFVRKALKKFVDEQMQAGDLVAIVQTRAGTGVLQQFTSDKNILYRAIDRMHANPSTHDGLGTPSDNGALNIGESELEAKSHKNTANERDISSELDEFHKQVVIVGTLGALDFVVRAMSELPGRKSMIMFSDGFGVNTPTDKSSSWRIVDNLSRFIDNANRASVVIYTVDAKGLATTFPTAADISLSRSPQQFSQLISERSVELFETQEGLDYLATETGGFLVKNTNDITGGVQRALNDQKGYYLIGFRPDERDFEVIKGRRRFNTLAVKVKRAGLRARYRSGFIGITDAEAKPVWRTRIDQLVGALSSPFSSGYVQLRLTSLFGGDTMNGAVVTSIMHIDMSSIKFTDEAEGWHKAVIDVIALTFGAEGQVIDEINRTETLRVRGKGFDALLRDGLVYEMRVPIKKPGAYQLRVAVRDASTEKLGSASQFIEVPNLKKDRLVLSGIVMQDTKYSLAPAAGEGKRAEPDPSGSPAVRRFHVGDSVDYFFNIYNARAEGAGRPQLQTQMRLFRDGQQVFAGPETPFDAARQIDMKNLQAGTRFHVSPALTPGEYVLQVVVTDALAPEKRRTATQWIDFEVVK